MSPHIRNRLINRLSGAVWILLILVQSCVDRDIPVPVIPDPQPPSPETLACGAYLTLGYTDKPSYYPDEEVTAFLQFDNYSTTMCQLDIYGVNGELIFSIPSPLMYQTQLPNKPYSNGFGFLPTVKFRVPDQTPSGVYLIENKIPFIIKTYQAVDLMVIYPSNTANAYAESGGRSLYSTSDRPVEVSFQRPIPLQSFSAPCLNWLSTLSEFSIGYLADIDLDESSSTENSAVLIVVGHSEYWTRQARLNFDAFVNSGRHAVILSGNTMWWQVRYSDEKTKLICHRELSDPIEDPLLKTITWDSPSLAYSILSSIGADFPHGGYGRRFDNGWDGYKIVTPNSPLLDGLNLEKGNIIRLFTTEFDGAPIKFFDEDNYPVIDKEFLNVDKIELIGFDVGFRVTDTYGTFFVMQRSPSSGIIVNTCSTDWCFGLAGSSAATFQKITYNAIEKLLHHHNMFAQ